MNESMKRSINPKPTRRRLWISILRIIGIGYTTIVVLLVIMESRMVYPGAFMEVPPNRAAGVERVEYQSADGTVLSGQLFEKPNAKNVLLFFHGNGITAARHAHDIVELAHDFDATVLAAEYRGYDGLQGSVNEANVVADAIAAGDYLCERYNREPTDLILYGQSLGGGCAVAVAANGGAKLLMLDRTFDRMVDVAAAKYWFVPVKILMRNRYDSIARIKEFDGPVVQWHGTSDRLIPINHARRLHEAIPSQEKFWFEIEGMGHNDRLPPNAWPAIRDQIRACLAKSRDNSDRD